MREKERDSRFIFLVFSSLPKDKPVRLLIAILPRFSVGADESETRCKSFRRDAWNPRTSRSAMKSRRLIRELVPCTDASDEHKMSRVKYGANNVGKQRRPVISTIIGDRRMMSTTAASRGWARSASRILLVNKAPCNLVSIKATPRTHTHVTRARRCRHWNYFFRKYYFCVSTEAKICSNESEARRTISREKCSALLLLKIIEVYKLFQVRRVAFRCVSI